MRLKSRFVRERLSSPGAAAPFLLLSYTRRRDRPAARRALLAFLAEEAVRTQKSADETKLEPCPLVPPAGCSCRCGDDRSARAQQRTPRRATPTRSCWSRDGTEDERERTSETEKCRDWESGQECRIRTRRHVNKRGCENDVEICSARTPPPPPPQNGPLTSTVPTRFLSLCVPIGRGLDSSIGNLPCAARVARVARVALTLSACEWRRILRRSPAATPSQMPDAGCMQVVVALFRCRTKGRHCCVAAELSVATIRFQHLCPGPAVRRPFACVQRGNSHSPVLARAHLLSPTDPTFQLCGFWSDSSIPDSAIGIARRALYLVSD